MMETHPPSTDCDSFIACLICNEDIELSELRDHLTSCTQCDSALDSYKEGWLDRLVNDCLRAARACDGNTTIMEGGSLDQGAASSMSALVEEVDTGTQVLIGGGERVAKKTKKPPRKVLTVSVPHPTPLQQLSLPMPTMN
jgi:hypothetical protein